MKKKLIFAFSVLAISTASSSYAQSSVMLYGLIDEGVLFNSNANGSRQYAAKSAGLQGDRWGLRGSEDLGGDLRAIFVLEGGYDVNTGALGQGGAEFGRQAYVGLVSPYGTVTLGRQYDALLDLSGYMFGNDMRQGGAGQLGGVPGFHLGDIDNLGNTTRVNNALKYSSPVYRGLKVVGEYSLSGTAGDFSKNQIWSVSATYDAGPFSAGVGFEKINNPNFSFYGDNPSGSATGNNMTAPVYSGYASAGTQQIAVAGASYAIGRATLGAIYSNVRFTDLGDEGGSALNPNGLSGTATFNTGELNFAYKVTPAWLLGAAYVYTHGTSFHSLPAAKYQQVDIGSDYQLSKRTDLYTLVLYQRASGYDSTLKPAVADLNGLTASSDHNQAAVLLGIRHKF